MSRWQGQPTIPEEQITGATVYGTAEDDRKRTQELIDAGVIEAPEGWEEQ